MRDEIIKKTTEFVANSLDELSIEYSKLGICLREQLGKLLIKKGGPWASIAFAYKNMKDNQKQVMLASFKSSDGEYKRFSYFNIKSKEEAELICSFLKEVFDLEKENV